MCACVCVCVCVHVHVYVCVCVHVWGGGGALFATKFCGIFTAIKLTTTMIYKPQLLAHLSEFSILFGVLLQHPTYSLVATTSSHLQGC